MNPPAHVEPGRAAGYGAPVPDAPRLNAEASAALKGQLKALIIQCCQIENVKPAELVDDAGLFGTEPLHLTSLDAVEIAVALEYRFGVELKNASSIREHFRSITAMADYLERTADRAKLEAALSAGLAA
jgi:acyl carrier protein